MRRWKYKCIGGTQLREAIRNDDTVGVLKALIDCYNEISINYNTDDIFFVDDCDTYVDEIDELLENDSIEDDDVNYELNAFYNFCDNMKIWVEL